MVDAVALDPGAGYVQDAIDPAMDLLDAIERLKTEKNAVVLAHYYQEADIQDLADYIGDSLGLSRRAAQTQADLIVFCGVHFMAETAKILNPTKKVLLPDLNAGCSLADTCPAEAFGAWLEDYPEHTVITYVNSSARVKALSDVICTSSSAAHIIRQIPEGEPIIFAPDRNLGRYLIRETGREMVLWDGVCIVHETFSEKKILRLKVRHPEALLIAHPECEEAVLRHADFVGSTSQLRRFVGEEENGGAFIVATEEGILHQMRKDNPQKTFIPAPPESGCNCSQCPHMRLNTLEKLYLCLEHEQPELHMDEKLRQAARRPIERMLALSKGVG